MGSGLRFERLGFRARAVGSRPCGSGFGVPGYARCETPAISGAWFRVLGFEFRV